MSNGIKKTGYRDYHHGYTIDDGNARWNELEVQDWLEGWYEAKAEDTASQDVFIKEAAILEMCPWHSLGSCEAINDGCSKETCAVLYLLQKAGDLQ